MKQIEHPRRLLVVGSPDCNIAGFVTELTGSSPVQNSTGSVAGSIHEWAFSTKYYSTRLPVWIDEISDVAGWSSEFSKPEAKEVVEAVGAWICCYCRSVTVDKVEGVLKAVDTVITTACGDDWDGVKLLALYDSPGSTATYDEEALDDLASDHGFQMIDANATGTNTFGEQQGFAQIVESLRVNDWSASSTQPVDEGEVDEQEIDDWAMKASLLHDDGPEDGGEDQLYDFENLIASVQAIKEIGQDLPPEQRRKVQGKAARALLSKGETTTHD